MLLFERARCQWIVMRWDCNCDQPFFVFLHLIIASILAFHATRSCATFIHSVQTHCATACSHLHARNRRPWHCDPSSFFKLRWHPRRQRSRGERRGQTLLQHHNPSQKCHIMSLTTRTCPHCGLRLVCIAWPANCCRSFEYKRYIVGSNVMNHHNQLSCPQHVLIFRPVVQQSELETLCECFPYVIVQFPEHLNHQVVVRT